MRYLVMIPARGGSKGLHKKNIYPICGKPMIGYTISLLQEAGWKDDIVVSTDSDEILEAAEKLTEGNKNFYLVKRPDEFAADTSSTEDAAFHAIKYMKEHYGREYDVLITMAPNLPLRTPQMFLDCIESFEKMPEMFDSQVCFCRSDEDLWHRKEKNEFVRVFADAPRRRQDREPLYIEKGSVTISKITAFKAAGSLWGRRVHGIVLDAFYGVDVHDENDIEYLEFLISKGVLKDGRRNNV